MASRVLRCGRPTFAVSTQCASRVSACSALFAWIVRQASEMAGVERLQAGRTLPDRAPRRPECDRDDAEGSPAPGRRWSRPASALPGRAAPALVAPRTGRDWACRCRISDVSSISTMRSSGRNRLRHGVQQRRLAGAGAARDEDVLPGVHGRAQHVARVRAVSVPTAIRSSSV